MRYLVNSKEMKQCDRNTIGFYEMPSMVLMERAALAVYSEIKKRFSKEQGKILILCGLGNNGGDGFAVARLLHLAGYCTEIFIPQKGGRMSPEALHQYQIVQKYNVPEITDVPDDSYSVIVDALFGIGLSRSIEEPLYSLISRINKLRAFRVAVDIASGISADTADVMGTAFRADLTVTFGFTKVGQLLYPGAAYTGELVTADIGIDENAFLDAKPSGRSVTQEDICRLLPKRSAYSNKGTYGKALLVAGSPDMAGAAYFAAKAAYYSGCGLVRILTAKENRQILLTKLPEAIITTYEADETEVLALEECIQWADAVLIGPGLSQSATARKLLADTLRYRPKKALLDADALNLLAKDTALLQGLSDEMAITPHLGEMSRLTGKTIPQIQKNLCAAALEFAGKYHISCVLKDSRTVIGMPDKKFFVNATGNHGMATGGSGDVLAGFITGFLAQGLPFETALPLAVWLHGAAGDLAAEKKGAYSMTASDLLEMLPEAIHLSGKESSENNGYRT